MHLSSFSLSERRWAASPAGVLYDAQDVSSIAVAAEQLGSQGRPLVEPGSLFCDGNYGIRLNTWNSLAGVTLHVVLRFLDSSGAIVDDSFDHTPNTNRTKATTDQQLGIGFPLNVMVFATAGAPLIGQTFVQVQLIRGLSGATTAVATLLQGYVTSVQAVAWPGSPIVSSIDGGGYYRAITGALPAAGAEMNETVPTGARWRIVNVRALLTTSSAAGTRRFLFRTNAAGPIPLGYVDLPATQPLSTTYEYHIANALVDRADAANTLLQTSMSVDTILLAGSSWSSVTLQMDAADQWAAPTYMVQEWLEAA